MQTFTWQLIISLASAWIAVSALPSLESFPDPMHTVGEVFLFKDLDISRYRIDEYIDRAGKRASLKLFSMWDSRTRIFYNEVKWEKFISFDVERQICTQSQINDWTLTPLRHLALQILPVGWLTSDMADVALGPTALLMAVNSIASKFNFVATTFSPFRLMQIDVFEMIASQTPFMRAHNESLLITAVMMRRKPTKAANPANLAEALQFSGVKDIIQVQACKVPNLGVKTRKARSMYDCASNELMAHIEYFLIDQVHASPAAGEPLDDTLDFDFHRDPFLQPIGIGCWNPHPVFDGFKRFLAPSLQFSAEYRSKMGTTGLSYIAYDGYRKLLRLDRDQRKSVYELSNKYFSYHMLNFHSNLKMFVNDQKCVTLEISDPTLKVAMMLERLIGVSQLNFAYHLGSKEIDHISYEVYELELTFDQLHYSGSKAYNLPIIFEMSGFRMPDEIVSSKREFYITYYVHEYNATLNANALRIDYSSTSGNNLDTSEAPTMMIPKFAELWEFDLIGAKKNLLNRVEFAQFSWALDLKPPNDADMNSDLFSVESCAPDRSGQLLIRFRIRPIDISDTFTRKVRKIFPSNRQTVKEIIQERLAKLLAVSRANLVHVDAQLVPQSSIIQVEVRLIDLPKGVPLDLLAGYARLDQIMEALEGDSTLAVLYNRHSTDSCRLDSLEADEDNVMMYCAGLALCVLFEKSALQKFESRLSEIEAVTMEETTSQDPKVAMCEVRQFRWAKQPTDRHSSVVERIRDDKLYSLENVDFQFNLRHKSYTSEESQSNRMISYRGVAMASQVKLLDSYKLVSEEPLAGLRYTVSAEVPEVRNANEVIELVNKRDAFRYCQLACQLDEYCQSFSVCDRKHGQSHERDCIISPLRLSASRIVEIADKLAQDMTGSKLLLTVSSSIQSQKFKLKVDSECNIHPKDFLAEYQNLGYLNMSSISSPNGGGNKSIADPTSDEEQPIKVVSSLDECASSASESTIFGDENLNSTSFLYCPISSICALNNVAPKEKLRDYCLANEICFNYTKSYEQFYEARNLMRVSLNMNQLRLSQLSESADKADQLKGLSGRIIEGLDENQCARDCNFASSRCLSFDLCRLLPEVPVCILHPFRSPIQAGDAKWKKLNLWLPEERQVFAREVAEAEAESKPGADGDSQKLDQLVSAATTSGTFNCRHFALKDSYFEIRLRRTLARSSQPISSSGREILDKRDGREMSELAEEEKHGDETIKNVLETMKQMAAASAAKLASTGGLHTILVIIGLLIGSAGMVYGKDLFILAADSWETFRARRGQRHINQRLSQLALSISADIDDTI